MRGCYYNRRCCCDRTSARCKCDSDIGWKTLACNFYRSSWKSHIWIERNEITNRRLAIANTTYDAYLRTRINYWRAWRESLHIKIQCQLYTRCSNWYDIVQE